MLLKNLMEEKQLNFDQPILSVRRFSPAVASLDKDNNRGKTDNAVLPRLPSYKTKLNSGPITNPGTVPFHWERCPGRPKGEIVPYSEHSNRPSIVPKLPPGKSSGVNQQDYNKFYMNTSVNKSQAQDVSRDVLNVDEKGNKFLNCNKKIEKECSQSEDSDEAYVDALDTFSSSESIFLNCSTSGLSGMDEPDFKKSGKFLTDPFAREFMMDRFLPAAKAMAADTPQFAPRRQPVVQEKPWLIKDIVNMDEPSAQFGSLVAQCHSEIHDDEEENDENYDQHGSLPAVCGLLPRFCLKGSFCLVNPVTAVSMKTKTPKSSVYTKQSRSSKAGSFRDRDNESSSNFPQQKSFTNQAHLRTELNSKSHQRQNRDGSSLCRQLEYSASVSFNESFPKEQGILDSSKEIKNHGINGLGSHKKSCKTFKDFLSERESSEESDSKIPVVEKILYVDTVQEVKSPKDDPYSSNMQSSKEQVASNEKEYEIVTNTTDKFCLADCSLKDSDKLETVDGAKLLTNSQRNNDSDVKSSVSNSVEKDRTEETYKVSEQDQESVQDSIIAPNVEVADKGAIESLSKQPAKAGYRETFHLSLSNFPIPPPSPISPSESWLKRTLPSMSTKNPHPRSHIRTATNPQIQVFKAQPADLKWETIVRTSKARQH